MENLRKLAIFSNGLSGVFGALVISKKDYTEKKSDFETKKIQAIESVVNELLKTIKDDDVRHALTAQTVMEPKSLLYELVEKSIKFDTDEVQKAILCKSTYPLIGNSERNSSNTIVEKINASAKDKDFVAWASLSCRPQIGGICFEFTLLSKSSV